MPQATGNLLFDSPSPNTGDAAIGLASEQVLRTFGIETRVVDPFSPTFPSPLLIGGGELIRTPGDDFYDSFRQPGRHILNAAGIWTDSGDLSYLRDYSFVSARSTREAEIMHRWVPDAKVIPCTTTILENDHYEIPGVVPGEPIVGIHMVPHSLQLIEELVPIINTIPYKKVFIPFTHYNVDASFMRSLPFDHSNSIFLGELAPRQLRSVFGQLTYAVVSSLHASIFSYSQNVPFASVYQTKAFNYFDDRGLAGHLVRDKPELIAMIERLHTEQFDFTSLVEKDRAVILETFRQYSQTLGEPTIDTVAWSAADLSAPRRVDTMLLEQARHVIRDRDLAISDTESRRFQAQLELSRVKERYSQAELELSQIRNTPLRKAARFALRTLRRVWKSS